MKNCEIYSNIHIIICFKLEPPGFIKKLENITTLSGNSIVFQSLLRGSKPMYVTWMKDKDDIQEDGNITLSFENNIATLQINAVEENHAGKYMCQVKNDAGTEKCFATLSVAEPAKITEQAQSLSVTAGNAANLECTVTGTPELKVKCFKDGNEMVPSRKHKISFENNMVSLKIPSVSNDDSAEYTFEVKNQFGTSSCKASLTVLG
ncbi:CAVP-target protein-like [Heptranchias perlo]|uniref:CAVP-target protein-like n=1 Tax=Heptranchias perlo TaxID=212740 RepID=UPI0035594FCC